MTRAKPPSEARRKESPGGATRAAKRRLSRRRPRRRAEAEFLEFLESLGFLDFLDLLEAPELLELLEILGRQKKAPWLRTKPGDLKNKDWRRVTFPRSWAQYHHRVQS